MKGIVNRGREAATTVERVSSESIVVSAPSPANGQRTTAELGIILFLASDIMLFSPFFAAYFLLRSTTDVWPADGVELDTLRAAAATLVLVSSSFTLMIADRALEHGHRAKDLAVDPGHDRPRCGVPREPDRRVRRPRLPAGRPHVRLNRPGHHDAARRPLDCRAGGAVGAVRAATSGPTRSARSWCGPRACRCSGTSSTSSGWPCSSRSG